MAKIIPIHQHKVNFNEVVKNLSDLCKEDLYSINTLILEKLEGFFKRLQSVFHKESNGHGSDSAGNRGDV